MLWSYANFLSTPIIKSNQIKSIKQNIIMKPFEFLKNANKLLENQNYSDISPNQNYSDTSPNLRHIDNEIFQVWCPFMREGRVSFTMTFVKKTEYFAFVSSEYFSYERKRNVKQILTNTLKQVFAEKLDTTSIMAPKTLCDKAKTELHFQSK